jgi:hypothetical protein
MLQSFLDHWLHSLTIARKSSRQFLIKEDSRRVLRFFGGYEPFWLIEKMAIVVKKWVKTIL